MTQDIASLGIKVETGEVAKASTELDGLAQAGAKAEKATESLSGESKKASISIKAMAAETKAAEAATAKLGKQTAATGVSATQTAAALRGVPAQVTDIITSLQGGQAPLTVLLQQGGQLKDMFGGVVPAAKALGGYVTGLINPFTLAAAAAAALGLAYYKGSEEATAYNKALIISGNAAGTSADQLGSLATQISSTIGTTGAAAEVLAQLAGSSKIAGESFGVVATAALEMQSATGKAIEETVAEFAKIGKDPVAAAKELNDQYNFLTASAYSQIVALKEQGDTIGAAKLLTDTYADTIKTRTTDVTANLSLIERGWRLVKEESKKALDATMDVGRAQSIDEQIAQREKLLADRKDGFLSNLFPDTLGAGSDSTKFIEGQIDALKRAKVQIEANAKAEGDKATIQREGIDAAAKLKTISDANLTNEEKRNKLIKEYKRDVEALRKANPDDPLVQADVVAKNIQNIKDKNKDPAGKANQLNLTGYNDAQNAIKDLQATYSNSEKELEAQQKAGLITQQNYLDQRTALIRAEREEVTGAYQAEIASLEAVKDKSSTTGEQRIQLDQKIADARTNMVKAQKDADSQLEVLATNEQGRLKKQALAIQTYTDALNQQNITLRQQGQREAASLGMGDRQKGLQSQFNGIDDKANAQRIDLANQYGDGSRGMSLDEYNAKLKAVAQSQTDLRNTAIANYNGITEAQSSWSAGASSAWQNYLESTRDVTSQTKSLFTNAFTSMEDAIVNFATTGKLSFSDFAKSVLSDMARIAVRQASSSALSSLFGIAASAAGGASAGGSASYTGAYGFDGGGYTGDGGKYQPAGIVHKGEVVIRKEVVQQRGMRGYLERLNKRGYADGGYVGSSDGSASHGGGGETPIVVNVDARESGASGVDPVRLAEAIKVTVRQEIATARRNGGQLA
ncbi:phage tail tape measure protein [Pseudomonas fluorescens group sp. PF-69]